MVSAPYILAVSSETPRIVRVTFGSKAKRAFLYLFQIAAVALCFAIAKWMADSQHALLDHGKTTTAKIVSKSITSNGRHDTDWHIVYRYKVGKTIYNNDITTDEDTYNATRVGAHALITYLPEDPDTVDVGVVTTSTLIEADLFLTVLVFGAGAICVAIIVFRE
jgi:hypothetical protein